MKYNVLVYGSGGREHALAWKISQSPILNKLFLALPNDGFKDLGEEIVFENFEDLSKKCVEKNIDLAIIGPEVPLVEGIVDVLNSYGIKCIGPNKKWAQLESSKKFAKEFMQKHNIPTAKYIVIKDEGEIKSVLSQFKKPPVIKADGLAAGKGVHIPKDFKDAENSLKEFLNGRWGQASKTVVVEEHLEGEELSVISLFDGETLLPLVPAKDYKRLLDGQKGPNTGGMGAYCTVELSDEQNYNLKKYLNKLENALKKENADFVGVIYSGLILTADGIKVLEYNMRFGDPETQSLMCHLDCDILDIFIKTAEKKLSQVKLKWRAGISINIVVASDGYPEKPKIGCEIVGINEAARKYSTQIFYAGVKKRDLSLLSNGGRILSVCKNGEDVEKIRIDILNTIDEIDFTDKVYRKDICYNN